MRITSYHLLVASAATKQVAFASPDCKCGPNDDCWPSSASWDELSKQVEGRLVKSEPLAISCYPGPKEDRAQCALVAANWAHEEFHTSRPLGLTYPVNITCPPVDYDHGGVPQSCSLGPNPRYAVNATTTEDIQHTIAFATTYNIRLVVKSTGHDLNGRSDGYGSLELWLRYHRHGIDFAPEYKPASDCKKCTWEGGAIRIRGAYQWSDVYAVAKANNAIVVGGGSPSVGAVGGWGTGGGHGPATRNYGLGADQILEAQVVLADGRVVTSNACEHSDLYKSLRGGGPGYGVILSFTVKAHPNVDVIAVQRLEVSPVVVGNTPELLDAVAILFQNYPDLNDAGYAGYGFWYLNSITPIFGNTSVGYYHNFWAINKSISQIKDAFAPVRNELEKLSSAVTIKDTYKEYHDYWSMYEAESGLHDAVGSEAALTSRLFDRASVSDYTKIRDYVGVASGKPEEYTSNVVLLVSGGQVAKDGLDPYSGLNPAWRISPFANVIGRGWAPGSSEQIKAYVRNDITNVKGAAQKAIAPNTGGYMNEGDRLDPNWKQTFYGANYGMHMATKRKYDPKGIFYCPTCVGSEEWVDKQETPLCRTG